MRYTHHLRTLSVFLISAVPLIDVAMGQQPAAISPPAELTPTTKAKTGKTKASPEQRSKDFRQRDKNSDGQLTLEEHLGQRQGDARVMARDAFFRSDANDDDLLSLDEFVQREPNRELTVHAMFRLQDVDDDGQLQEEEFMRTKLGKKIEQASRDNFRKFDVNRDGRLSEREFAMLPTNSPDAATMFRGLDVNSDGRLTLEERTALQNGQARISARDSFFRHDLDENELLSLEEYLDPDAAGHVSTHNAFRVLDLNDDLKLTEEEFMRPKLAKGKEHSGVEIFHRFDLDHDQRLSEREFAMTPAQKPSLETMFVGLDFNTDGTLTRDEFLASFANAGIRRGHRDFLLHDRNHDGRLSFEEYSQEISSSSESENEFAIMDYDADGVVTLSEFCKLPPPTHINETAKQRYEIALMKAEDRFGAADINRDGRLTEEEFAQISGNTEIAASYEEYDGPFSITVSAADNPATVTGIGPKSRDLFPVAVVGGKVLLGAIIVMWWLARRQVSKQPKTGAIHPPANTPA